MKYAKRQLKRLMAGFKLVILLSVGCFGTLAQADMAYIANFDSGNVSVIDTSTNKVVATIAVGGTPYSVAVNSTGTRVYMDCNGSICIIDTSTNSVIAKIPLPAGRAWGWGEVAIDSTNTLLYMTCGDSICVMNFKTNKEVGSPIPVGKAPNTIALNPSNTRIYVTNTQSHDVSVIDTTNNSTVATIKVGMHPFGAEITPDGSKLYVASQSGTVSVINTSNNSVVKTIPVGGGSTGVAINPTGTRVYVTNHFGTVSSGIPSNTVSVIDTSTDTTIATIPVGTMPVGVSVNLAGTRVYVTNVMSNNVSVIDTVTNKVIDTVPVGSKPYSQGKFIGTTNTCLADTNGSTQAGIDQCKANPVSCGITSVDTNGSTQTGIDQCKTNPASCGLFTQAQIDAAKQACKTDPLSCGIIVSPSPDQCKTNPASCGLFTQAQIDAAKQAAIAQCKTTPASCGITFIDNNGSTQTGIAQCKANPASCGITKLDGISTNAFITPTNKMIAGVLISGGTKRLMVRASSVDGAVDPQLEIVTYPDRKPLGSNDSWATDPAAAELTQKKLAPARATDAAIIVNLPPGLFTMEITSKNSGSGAGLIEVYDMAVFP
jgi:YVTN family beta-propeller protein